MTGDRDRPSGQPDRSGPAGGGGQDAAPEPGSRQHPSDEPSPFEGDQPVRRGSVDLQLRDGERVHHDEAFVRYEPDVFVVATDASFSPATTDRYPKDAVAWLDVRHPRR